ncbi:MAG: hypothetical protein AAGC55_28605, partial [Myxococcota bacterium]
IWLAYDDPERAIAEADLGMEWWAQRSFQLQHFLHASARARAALYAGTPGEARTALLAIWPELERSMLLRVQAVRVEALFLRARVALAEAGGDRAESDRPPPIIDDAMQLARKLAREESAAAGAASLVIQAGVAYLRGSRVQCASHLKRAAHDFAGLDMELFAVACKRAVSALGGSHAVPDRHAIIAHEDRMRRLGVGSPSRFSAVLLGFSVAGAVSEDGPGDDRSGERKGLR